MGSKAGPLQPLIFRSDDSAPGRLIARAGAIEVVIEKNAPGWVWGCLLRWNETGCFGGPGVEETFDLGMGSLEAVESRFRQATKDGGLPGRDALGFHAPELAVRPWLGHRPPELTVV